MIDYSESDFIAWQAEREAMWAENERLRETMQTIAHLAEGTRIGGMARAALEGK